MTSDAIDQLAVWQDGLTSDFWAQFRAHIEREWGKGGERFHLAVKQSLAKPDSDSLAMLRMVMFAQTEIERLLAYPSEQASRLKHEVLAARGAGEASRRGPGL